MPRGKRLPVHPNLENLKKQAKSLLDAYCAGEPEVVSDFEAFHPLEISPEEAKLTDAQLVLARSYQFSSWPKMQLGARFCAAVCEEDVDAVRALVTDHPELLTEEVRGERSHWGAAMGFAANLGKTAIVQMLAEMDDGEVQHAFERAVLQGKIETARALMERGARLERGVVMGPCETLNNAGLQMVLDLGAELCDKDGNALAPVAMLLETYSRNPKGKHACLQILEEQGVGFPDTPVMAFHRGRLDLLEEHLNKDVQLLSRRFRYDEIYPPEFRVWGNDTGLHGTPLDGTTLLHMAIDYDEDEIFDWLLDRGADVNAQALVDADGFGGHSPLFNCVVKQGKKEDRMVKVLLEKGADPGLRASIRKGLKSTEDETVYEYRDVMPLEYAAQFRNRQWVNEAAVAAVRSHHR